MGSSISVKFGSVEERNKMMDFLERQDFSSIQEGEENFRMQVGAPITGDGLTLPARANPDLFLGYHASGLRPWAMALCAWAALQSSVRDKAGRPVICYDDVVRALIVEREPTTDEAGMERVDARGVWQNRESSWIGRLRDLKAARMRREWVEGLNEAWKHNLNHQPTAKRPGL